MDRVQTKLDRHYQSEPVLFSASKVIHTNPLLLNTFSLPNLTSSSSLSLIDEDFLFTRQDLTSAADILINIVNESQFILPTSHYRKNVKKDLAVSDRILGLVYGTMKYLPYIDTILVKTQFLVYNTQFLHLLGLVKIMIYVLMKHNFELTSYDKLEQFIKTAKVEKCQDEKQAKKQDLDQLEFQELMDALKGHNTKLAAAFARIRIEKMATGNTFAERMENILPQSVRQLESLAGELPKTLRINLSKTSIDKVKEQLELADIPFTKPEPTRSGVHSDEDFRDLLVVSTDQFNRIKSMNAFNDGSLVYQDKSSMFAPRHIVPFLRKSDKIIDARAGCGVRACYLSCLLKQSTVVTKRSKKRAPEPVDPKILAFENRAGRLETLKARIQQQNEGDNIEVVETNFLSAAPHDPRFASVTCIIVEPPHSGTAIMDKLGYLLQEEGNECVDGLMKEFPNEQYTHKDILTFKQSQVNWLKHAFKFPNVKHIIYITRSSQHEENSDVVEELLERYAVEWELECIFPNRVIDSSQEYKYEECLSIPPSEQGNGVFVAHFQKMEKEDVPDAESSSSSDGEEEWVDNADIPIAAEGDARPIKKKMKKRTSKVQKTVARNRFDPPALTKRKPKLYNNSLLDAESSDEEPVYKKPIKRKSKTKAASHDAIPKGIPRHIEARLSTLSLKEKNVSKKVKPRRSKVGGSSDTLEDSSDEYQVEDKLTLYGMGLKRFYAPHFHALKQLKKGLAKSKDSALPEEIPSKWKYPVPNPTPWK